MEEQLVSFEVAKLAKEKGFIEKVFAYFKTPTERGSYPDGTLLYSRGDYGEDIKDIEYNYNSLIPFDFRDRLYTSAPTQSLLQRWLREVHEIFIDICSNPRLDCTETTFDYTINYKFKGKYRSFSDNKPYKTYEEALEEGLKQALQLITI